MLEVSLVSGRGRPAVVVGEGHGGSDLSRRCEQGACSVLSGFVTVGPNLCYSGQAGKDGCEFVEGHKRLSFSSAERFVARKVLRRVDRPERDSIQADMYDERDYECE